MQTVLIVIHLMIVLALVGVVLLQRSEGGALGMGGGGGGFMTGRGQANILTRATSILAGLFFATSLTLTVLAHYGRDNKSILDRPIPAGPSQSAPAKLPERGQGNLFDQLRKIETERSNRATPAQAPTSSGSRPPAAAPVEPTGIPDKPAAEAPSAPKQ